MAQMTGYRIRIAGDRLNKAGELVPDVRRLSVSERLRQAESKRVRPRVGCLVPAGHAKR